MASISQSKSILGGLKDAVVNRFKPHRTEALLRIRFNMLGLVVLFILATLLPLPSLPKAIIVTLTRRYSEKWNNEWTYRWICVFETSLAVIFSVNILQSAYAIKYPRAAPPPTPAKRGNALDFKSPKSTQNTPQKSKLLASQSSPQPQKPFSFSPSSSLSSSLSGSTLNYPPSPVSTPTRVMQYSTITTPRSGLASSTSTVGYTPSPAVPAYRGKLFNSTGRALDGSYLGRIVKTEDSDSDDP
ncbi:hypothetical protein DFP72DRAFT_881305 [Ephemerocybe angulata]|uniref:Uncharacterized protein n=1 Tax=Ephemerocybe angulata TaxID=980116 RepID=A0A8H6I871_9AGAR|nr:hypothetical protein DFP72DRAFT_881305 [Tulosesus angulatus]